MPDSSPYDFLLVGGGLAGLSVACHLAEAGLLRDRRLLILDRTEKRQNDRTWSYWSRTPTPFDHLAVRTWDCLYFYGDGERLRLPMGDYRYRTIRGIDFYRHARARLAQEPGVKLAECRRAAGG